MRSRTALVAVVLVAAGIYGATAAAPPGPGASGSASGTPAPSQLIEPGTEGDYVWPYTSRRRSVAGRTLALNVVVHGDSERIRRALVDRSGANWSAVDESAAVSVSPWRPAHGSTRYTYVTQSRTATGRWVAADYQLDAGTYFGRRTHARAYAGPAGDWTAFQAHTEYWDWFRVRHTVTGVATGARFVERDLRDEPFVAEISRTYHGRRGGGSDGWWTVVRLTSLTSVAGLAVPLTTRRRSVREVLLPGALICVVLGVRAWGLGAEALFPGVTPKLFVALGYPVLAAGPPLLVGALARERPPARAALLAAVGLGAGVTLDLAVLGIRHVPVRLVLHRVALLAALGALAFGTAREDRRLVGVAVGSWLAVLAAPLLGVP